jgi:hypothetical protein
VEARAEHALLAAPARLTGVWVAEFAEDLAQSVVHALKDGGPVGEVTVL